MTVAELKDRMTVRELAQWDEWYALKAEAEAADNEPAAKRQQQRRGRG